MTVLILTAFVPFYSAYSKAHYQDDDWAAELRTFQRAREACFSWKNSAAHAVDKWQQLYVLRLVQIILPRTSRLRK